MIRAYGGNIHIMPKAAGIVSCMPWDLLDDLSGCSQFMGPGILGVGKLPGRKAPVSKASRSDSRMSRPGQTPQSW